MIHLHINRVFVHDMWCGLKALQMPEGDKFTFDLAKVDCPKCLELIAAANPDHLQYLKYVEDLTKKQLQEREV